MRGTSKYLIGGASRSPSVALSKNPTPGPSHSSTPTFTIPVLPPMNKSRQYTFDDEDEEYEDLGHEEEEQVGYEYEDGDPLSTIAFVEVRDEAAVPETINSATSTHWDNGEEVTPDERNVLLAMDSDEQRAYAMMIRRRDRESLEDGLIESIPPILPKTVTVGPQKRAKKSNKENIDTGKTIVEGETKDKSSEKEPRRSTRKLPVNPPMAGSASGQNDSVTTLTLTVATTAHSSSSTSILALNGQMPSLPDWIEDAMSRLDKMCDGAMWTSILVKWIDLETQLEFPKGRVSNHFNRCKTNNLPIQYTVKDTYAIQYASPRTTRCLD